MSSIYRGGGLNDFPRIESIFFTTSSRAVCLAVQLNKNEVDTKKNCKYMQTKNMLLRNLSLKYLEGV
jgi:hypothetical protein